MDFGDGTVVTVDTVTVDHTYAAEGVYDLTLTVTDSTGLSDADATTATIYPAGSDADVFLNLVYAPMQLRLLVDREVEGAILVFGDGDTIEQEATVKLKAEHPDGLEVEIEPSEVDGTVVPGRPLSSFELRAEIDCEQQGTYVILWTATIEADQNADPTNDTVQAETTVECLKPRR